MKKAAFHNLGCKVNSYEMEYMQQEFAKNGYEIVPFAEKADIYVVNTCTVTNIADRKSRQMLHQAKKRNPDALVVATGCYVQTDREGALGDPMIDLLVGNNRKADIVRIVEEALFEKEEKRAYVSDLKAERTYEDMDLSETHEHTRVSVKIQDGCDQFCSYCIIPHARGRARSREKEKVLSEIEMLSGRGYREVVLTGIHLSAYGIDLINPGKSYQQVLGKEGYTNGTLLSLIEDIDRGHMADRIRLGSLEPGIITGPFLKRLKEIPSFCDHFHISLQSGSDEVLKRMNRHYTTEEYLQKVGLIREYFPMAAVTTDVIVGFPMETEEEFLETRRFLSAVDFYEVHVFKYSRRKGTVADGMSGQLTERVKKERSELLIADSRIRQKAFMQKMIGNTTELLTEEAFVHNGETYMTGFTKNYVRCALKGTGPSGKIVKCTVKGFLTDEILEVSGDK
ncbi:MAG: tRNA (N(6)-L-threonylcarbamoyladenosine(37)-C(2))-methylthiotransferase MtaB [Lachnospiraceae bacterium]|nr:tRNA (N(6)-L-threonylcarbamoyladenosine(37)-C(2))-methylthiotransferase MtaB [Lachnospiraceae bacterium]